MHRNFRNITTNISCAYPRLLWKIPLLYKTISTPFVALRATGLVWTLLEPCPPVAAVTKCSEPEKNLAMNERVCVTWDRQTQAGPTSFAEEGGTVVRSKPYCHNNTPYWRVLCKHFVCRACRPVISCAVLLICHLATSRNAKRLQTNTSMYTQINWWCREQAKNASFYPPSDKRKLWII